MLILTLFLGTGLVTLAQRRTPPKEFKQELNMIPPIPSIERWVFGYDDIAADTLWLRVIQDLHVCENAKDGIAHREGETHTGWLCERGWVFKMIDAITTLAPNWKLPYTVGATMLSIVVDDRVGATEIFEKGLKIFPDDYNLLYRASYHYTWEEKNPKRAAELLVHAAKHGGPPWFISLAGKLYSEAGQAEIAKVVLEESLKGNNSPEIQARLENRLREVNKTLADEALKR